MKAWAGLGYYSRARNLKAAAEISRGCRRALPRDRGGAAQTLPGVGDYTAAAIAAIAFDRAGGGGRRQYRAGDRPAVRDRRPPARRQGRDPPPVRRALTPAERPGDYAQAMMDLGATICTPKRPACSALPVDDACAARAAGTSGGLSGAGRTVAAADAERRRLRRGARRRRGAAPPRPPRGLLGGMTEVPGECLGRRGQDGGQESAPSRRCLAPAPPARWSMSSPISASSSTSGRRRLQRTPRCRAIPGGRRRQTLPARRCRAS